MLINLHNKFTEHLFQFLIIILAFLAPIVPLIILVGIAIVFDTVTGIAKAYKLKETITSRKLSNLVSKMVLYQAAILLFFGIETYILGDIIKLIVDIPLFLTKIVGITLISIELISINENLDEGFGFNLWEHFKLLLKRAKKVKKEIEDTKKILKD